LPDYWRDQGRSAAARNLLAPVYRWFTRGFATPDLKETKALQGMRPIASSCQLLHRTWPNSWPN
jgi:hypothetical protein